MREVFIHFIKKTKLWDVVDKKTGESIEQVDDVLLFNASYKRFKDIKGWHGVLSETINQTVIDLLQDSKFNPVQHIKKRYYPRYSYYHPRTKELMIQEDHQVKAVKFLRASGSEVLIEQENAKLSDSELKIYTAKYKPQYETMLEDDDGE